MLRHRRSLGLVLLLLIGLTACNAQTTTPTPPDLERVSGRKPAVADWSQMLGETRTVPAKPSSNDPFAVDMRQGDYRDVDLSQSKDVILNYAAFDSGTKWPVGAKMPPGLDPARMIELGKDPGLGVRTLHQQGITGRGIHVAIIDQALLLEHQEYQDRIESYYEIGSPQMIGTRASMHGPAVMSILAGKTVGVAPDVKVTYYAVEFGTGLDHRTFRYLAKAVQDILDDNRKRPESEKVKVISTSIGWRQDEDGYAEMDAAAKRARDEGVFIVSSSVEQYYSFRFHGLNRDPLADPNDPRSYGPGLFWRDDYFRSGPGGFYAGRVMIPMDSRATAAPTGTADYAFYRQGGWSWCAPYIAGLYAMALQVNPKVTPDQFYKAAVATGDQITVTAAGKSYDFGPIINPVKLIAQVKAH